MRVMFLGVMLNNAMDDQLTRTNGPGNLKFKMDDKMFTKLFVVM